MSKRSRFIRPVGREFVKLDLSDGDWVKIKARLTNREQRRITMAGWKNLSGDDKTRTVEIDWTEMDLEKVLIYVTEWSFREDPENESSRVVEFNAENLAMLDTESFREIVEAIERYQEAEEESRKNSTGAQAP